MTTTIPMLDAQRSADAYTVHVDSLAAAAWHAEVAAFGDASLYQAWQQEDPGVSRLLLRHDGQVVAAAEVRLLTIPFTGRGIAYVRWGPLWRRRGRPESLEVLRRALRALREEYAVRRGMVLRLAPRLTLQEGADYTRLAAEEGFTPVAGLGADQSLLLPLTGDAAEIRKSLDQKWRNTLNKAEKAGLTITEGTDTALFDEFTQVYAEMLERKQFAPTADFDKHRQLQALLPEDMKMGVMLARHEGRLCAGVIYSALGDTGVYLFGAINETGMRTAASYLLQWETVKRLKDKGLSAYDLNGINAEANPGTYHFKKGLAGKKGTEVTFVGQFQAFRGSLSNYAVLAAERLRRRLRRMRSAPAAAARGPAPASAPGTRGAGAR